MSWRLEGSMEASHAALGAPARPRRPQPHLPLQVQTALPQLIPLISLLTQEVVPSGLRRGVEGGEGRGSQGSTGRDGGEAGISRGREEEPRSPQALTEGWDPRGLEER